MNFKLTGLVLCRADRHPVALGPAELPSCRAGGVRHGHRELAALQAVRGPSAARVGERGRLIFTSVMTVFVLGPLMLASARCSPRPTRCCWRSRPPTERNRGSSLAGGRAAGRRLGTRPVAERACAPRSPVCLGAADRLDGVAQVGARSASSWFGTCSSSDSPSWCCFSCTGKASAGGGVQAGAPSRHRRAGRRLYRHSLRALCALR